MSRPSTSERANVVFVFSAPKNSREELRAKLYDLTTASGTYRLAELRIYASGPDGEPVPTKKGLSVRVEQIGDLQAAVQALVDEIERESTGEDS